ncbi:DUF3788 domain-containing protein [bacterium]|nr:DUF3788 domain-containing protein [bacterium]
MALSALDDKSVEPNDEIVAEVLGFDSLQLWLDIRLHIAETYPPMTVEWNFPGAKYGWSCRLVQRKRCIIYLIPQEGHFLAAFVFGEKALELVRKAGIPDALLEELENARKYAEGRGIRFPVRTRSDVETVKKLATCKMAK